MKQQTKSNLLKSLQSLGIVFAIFFAMAFACGDDSETDTEGNNPRQNKTTNQALPPGEYTFMSMTTMRDDGSPNVTTNVTGALELLDDGTYEHNIWIGNSPGGCGPGTYSISGNKLRIMPAPEKGCNPENWSFIYDRQINRLSLVSEDKAVTLLYCVAGETNCFKKIDR